LGLVGLLECLEAAIAREPRDFFPHLQNGILDVVVGALIILSLGGGPGPSGPAAGGVSHRQGRFPPRAGPNDASGAENHGPGGRGGSVLLGLLIWAGWPSAAAWLLAFCLGAEIGLRGWPLMILAFWLKTRPGYS
jgi:uncharacterized membrane protein HdeD (DUF308 family)